MKKGKKNKRKQISLSLLFGDDYDVWRVQFFISNLHKRAKQKQQKNLNRCDAVEIDFMRKVM